MMPSEKREITLSCSVDNYRAGWTIVEFLAHRFKYHTADGWETRVRESAVRVNGAAVTPAHVVHRDDAVTYTILHAEPEVDDAYQVLYEDDELLAVSKSGNIPVHACGVYITHTLIGRLKADFGDGLNLAHRLDRETSGVVLLTKTPRAARVMGDAFRDGRVKKTYTAVVYGSIPVERFEIDAPLGRIDQRHQYPVEYARAKTNNMASFLPKVRVDFENGKPAKTLFKVVNRMADYTVLHAQPVTGRTNQIRVHLSHIGYPIVGDKIYALDGALREECIRKGLTDLVRSVLVMDRHALHCEEMSFEHPADGTRVRINAPIPDDLGAMIFG